MSLVFSDDTYHWYTHFEYFEVFFSYILKRVLFTHIIFMVFGYEFLVRTLKTSFVIEENDEETKFIPSPLSTISYIIEIFFFIWFSLIIYT